MAKLTPVCVDLETFWSQDHTLTKMNPIVYCLHKETELLSLAYKFANDPAHCVVGEGEIKAWAKQVDWSDKFVYGHNLSLFDSMILRWRLGVKPAMWGCTLAMARPIHGLTVGGSLAKLVEHYGIGVKDQSAIINTKGRHLKDFTPEEIEALRRYNMADVEQCAELFKRLLPLTPKQELRVIDMTIRMLVEPRFRVDVQLLEETLKAERDRKQLMLLDVATMIGAYDRGMNDEEIAKNVEKVLASQQKFAKLLRDLGVEVPMKPSPANPEKQTYALAKTDEGMQALLEHDDPIVSAAARARLGVKSTILETRIESFLEVAKATKGRMPIAKNYCGAATGRFSGAFSLNQENLPRIGGESKPSDALRNSLIAPPGHKVVVADLSSIELRVNMYLWKVPYAMALFDADPEHADLYKALASEVFDVPVDGMPKMIRQAGKAMHLGCGYGLGNPEKYVAVAKQIAGLTVAVDEAAAHISGYRAKHPEVVAGWRVCDDALTAIAQGAEREVDPWGLVHTDADGFVLPSGRKIRYPGLRKEDRAWVYGDGRNKASIYGGKADENIVQALARDILVGYALEINKRYRIVHTVHDEIVIIVPEDEAEEALKFMYSVMRTPPKWWPALKTWAEGGIGDSYGGAK